MLLYSNNTHLYIIQQTKEEIEQGKFDLFVVKTDRKTGKTDTYVIPNELVTFTALTKGHVHELRDLLNTMHSKIETLEIRNEALEKDKELSIDASLHKMD